MLADNNSAVIGVSVARGEAYNVHSSLKQRKSVLNKSQQRLCIIYKSLFTEHTVASEKNTAAQAIAKHKHKRGENNDQVHHSS